ncbi:hypothetical protein [Teichococcus aestuarii]|uniref:hypothetical protein n=1 Tax=Teichococcus aestuarii TaxID=568898 RepID=UPI00360759C8
MPWRRATSPPPPRWGAKQAALEAFLAARAAIPPEALRPVAADLALLVDRLRAGVEANRAMLQQALAVQARVIETMARAAGQAASATQGYGPAGTAGAAPLALSLRA